MEAETWTGTPFYPRQAIKGAGCDCVAMALAIYQRAGAVPPTVELPAGYKVGNSDHLDRSLVLDWLSGSGLFNPVAEWPASGDLVVFRVGRVVHHCGVMLDGHDFMSVTRGYAARRYDIRDSTWHNRFAGAWRPCALNGEG